VGEQMQLIRISTHFNGSRLNGDNSQVTLLLFLPVSSIFFYEKSRGAPQGRGIRIWKLFSVIKPQNKEGSSQIGLKTCFGNNSRLLEYRRNVIHFVLRIVGYIAAKLHHSKFLVGPARNAFE
jgi:hypothetical protein